MMLVYGPRAVRDDFASTTRHTVQIVPPDQDSEKVAQLSSLKHDDCVFQMFTKRGEMLEWFIKSVELAGPRSKRKLGTARVSRLRRTGGVGLDV
jgi:hypothetical protein